MCESNTLNIKVTSFYNNQSQTHTHLLHHTPIHHRYYTELSKVNLIPLLSSQALLTQRRTLEKFCVLKIIIVNMQAVQYLRRETVDRLLNCLDIAYKLLLVIACLSNIFVCFGSFSLFNVALHASAPSTFLILIIVQQSKIPLSILQHIFTQT